MKHCLCLLVCASLAALTLQAEDRSWDYYSSILEKGMFPKPPPPPPPPVEEPKIEPPPPNWKINFKVNMVHKRFSDGEIQVGVTNIKGSEGRPVNMMLGVGESHEKEGIKIESVEMKKDEPSVVMISKDGGDPVTFELASTVAAPGSSGKALSRGSAPGRVGDPFSRTTGKPQPSTRTPPVINRGSPPSSSSSGNMSSREAALKAWRERMQSRSRGGR